MAIAAWCAECRIEAAADHPAQLREFFTIHMHESPSSPVTMPTPRAPQQGGRLLLLTLSRP